MRISIKVLLLPLLAVLTLLSHIPRKVWDFLAGCLLFWGAFKLANHNIDNNSIADALQVVFWDAVLGLVALQTLPELFFDIFNGDS
ncbi:hypothetical protein [Methylophilus sp. DW102]|uniref:hypothetical protein n=1 Tax=Methylophilus sp. DW102 TaxID=3095607 RepID=UPI0030911682|nr:hypothetical protein MTDW_05440 [Methylophilus sp. DW102]